MHGSIKTKTMKMLCPLVNKENIGNGREPQWENKSSGLKIVGKSLLLV